MNNKEYKENKEDKVKKDLLNDIIELCSKLKLIASISPGEKLYHTNDNNFSTFKPYNLYIWLKRAYNGESQKDTLIFIKDTITKSISIIEDNPNTDKIINLYNDLINSKNGIIFLKSSYDTEKNVIADLNVFIDLINTFEKKNTKKT